jgi:small-conductance mechanosensitive channel
MSILWFLPPLVVLIFILYYNFTTKRGVSRPAEFFRLLIGLILAVVSIVLFIWVILSKAQTGVIISVSATMGAALTFLLKDPGSNLRQM